MVEILLQYVERSLKKCPEQGKIQVMEQHFQVMGHQWKASQMSLKWCSLPKLNIFHIFKDLDII